MSHRPNKKLITKLHRWFKCKDGHEQLVASARSFVVCEGRGCKLRAFHFRDFNRETDWKEDFR